ncbi:MAG: prolipoprotein diacylglyceryl transferase [Lachnospiraceae bacterium]|nr:prolipoprotein diacylglyceryl transferase [Lachnospiraceae bacterium]
MDKYADIIFPHLGITIDNLGKGINVFGYTIAFYGMIIALGMILGYLIVVWQAKRTGQDDKNYLDLALWCIIFAIIGARLYYVVFSWDYYSKNPSEIMNIRGGGLAIYGGIIAGVITVLIFSKIKKLSFMEVLDTACAGLLVGQILGRWGNFFNREAFGGYTDNVFAMMIKKSDVSTAYLSENILNHIVEKDSVAYIQVHPTFLYESCINIIILIIILLLTKKKKFDGMLLDIYLFGYGLSRFFIEGLRTDQLKLFGTKIAVSQVVSLIIVAIGLVHFIYNMANLKKSGVKDKAKSDKEAKALEKDSEDED